MTAHPRERLDDLVHQPVRFSILAGLAQADELEFRFLRDTLQISDSLLSRQASTLEQAGYIAIRKGHVGKWPRTWLKLTAAGRTAFGNHLKTLQEIVESPTSVSTS
jgi:DNA-binding MarR family transcriptional regulator